MEEFLQSGYDIDGMMYYSFEQIGAFLYPEKCSCDATNKIRKIYLYRRKDLEQYTTKTKCWWSNQTIVVINQEGLKKLCGFIKKSDCNEKVSKLKFCINFS